MATIADGSSIAGWLRRVTSAMAVLGALISLVGGGPMSQAGALPAGQHLVVALGDSVPAGDHCDCTAFPEQYAALLQQRTGHQVQVRNDAVDGLNSTQLEAQLAQPDVAQDVARADIVLITIGANDFELERDDVVSGRCHVGNRDCVSDELAGMRVHLAYVIEQIRALRHGRPTTILVTGYWNVFQDGSVGRTTYGPEGLDASVNLTRQVNDQIRATTIAAGDTYVDVFAPFQDADDIGALLSSDGDHPNAAGHTLLAETLVRAGLPRTTWS